MTAETVGVLLFSPAAFAQMRAEAVPESVLRPASVVSSASVADPIRYAPPRLVLPETRSNALTPETALPITYTATFLGSTLQVDMPHYDNGGKYVRPKFYVGMQSESMRNWMNASGIAAERCMLPMLRARTSMSGDGEVSGSLWVYARCSFH